METKFDERLRHHEAQLDSRCTGLTESCARLDVRLSEQKESASETLRDRAAQLAEQIQAARTYMNERYSHLDQHFSQTHAEFEDKMLQKHVVVESRLDQVTSALRTCEAQGSRTEAEIERVDSSGKDQRDHFVKMLAALEKTTEEHRVEAAAVMDDVKGRIAQNFAHFTNLVGSLEAKQTATDTKIEGTAQAVTDSRDKFTGLCARLEADQREDRRLSADSVSDLQGKLARDKTDSDTKIQSLRQQLVDGNLNLDSKFSCVATHFRDSFPQLMRRWPLTAGADAGKSLSLRRRGSTTSTRSRSTR